MRLTIKGGNIDMELKLSVTMVRLKSNSSEAVNTYYSRNMNYDDELPASVRILIPIFNDLHVHDGQLMFLSGLLQVRCANLPGLRGKLFTMKS